MWTLLWNKSCISIFLKTKRAFQWLVFTILLAICSNWCSFLLVSALYYLVFCFSQRAKFKTALCKKKWKRKELPASKFLIGNCMIRKIKPRLLIIDLLRCVQVYVWGALGKDSTSFYRHCVKSFSMIAVTWITDSLLLQPNIPFSATIDI